MPPLPPDWRAGQIRSATPPELGGLLIETSESLSVRKSEVVKDYCLTRGLHRLSVETSGTGRLLASHQNPSLAGLVCAFGGGTSLVSAWDVGRRYSEDLDLLCLMDTDTSAKALRVPHKKVSRLMFDAVGVEYRKDLIRHRVAAGFRETKIPIQGINSMLKIESMVEPSDDSLFRHQTVTSLMGRFATAAQMEKFPELGGFSLPCVVPAYTVANKFDALHWRAVAPGPGTKLRGRDLYDLHAVACSPYADEVRARMPELADRAAASPIRPKIERPVGGYGRSIVFQRNTKPYDALRKQYELAVSECVWDADPPPFDEAVELAVSLDVE